MERVHRRDKSDIDFATFITGVGLELDDMGLDADVALIPDWGFNDLKIHFRFNRINFEYDAVINYNTWLYPEVFDDWKADLIARIQHQVGLKIYSEEKECYYLKYSTHEKKKS